MSQTVGAYVLERLHENGVRRVCAALTPARSHPGLELQLKRADAARFEA